MIDSCLHIQPKVVVCTYTYMMAELTVLVNNYFMLQVKQFFGSLDIDSTVSGGGSY